MKALISSVALAAALTFSGAAVAQNMIGGAAIPGDRVDDFRAACEALRAESTASLTTDDTQTGEVELDETETGSVSGSVDVDEADPAAQDNWDEALANLTLEQCDEGFPVSAM